MKRHTLKIILFVSILGASEANAQMVRPVDKAHSSAQKARVEIADANEPSYLGKPLSYWRKSLQNRDGQMDMAFEAIRTLGPAAAAAVPELTQIVSEPVTPIEIGVDDYSTLSGRLLQIQLHSNAVDCLTAIGQPAASSAAALSKWALATKVILTDIRILQDRNIFVDLVGLDVLERMRVAGAIARFTPDAGLVVADLLKSPDGEARKLGVAILSERTLPIATALLKSDKCSNRDLGLRMLADMWPVVAKEHLLDLKDFVSCTETEKH